MKENQFQKKVKKQLENQGAFVINLHGHGMQISGLPDLEIIHRDWKGFLEIKVEKNKCSLIQRIQAAKIESRKMPIYVLRCIEKTNEERLWIKENIYQLENFEDKIIKTFNDLNLLLNILQNLELKKECDGLTGDSEKCVDQCTDETRMVCRKKYNEVNKK